MDASNLPNSGEMTADQIKELSGCENLSEIRQLNLSNTGIANLDGKILQQLTSLEELNLSKNKLSKLEIRDFVIIPSLKVLDLSQNQLTSVDGLISFPNLESLVLSENSKLEVADKYKVVSLLPKLKLLDGKDVSQMKDAVTRLDTVLLAKVEEVWSKHFTRKWIKEEEAAKEMATQIEEEFLSKLKAEVTCGPLMLKPYREFKLTILGKDKVRKLKEIRKERIKDDEPLAKKQKVVAVNGDAIGKEKIFAEQNDDSKDKVHQMLEKNELFVKTTFRNVKKEKRKEFQLSQSEYLVSHLLQTHSLNNDPSDRQTQVWGCAFEPDANMPDQTTFTCATCGGDSVCFIDCSTGRVMKKYRQPGETFYCLAWTTVTLDFGNGNLKRTNLIAAGGLQKDIKIIEPTQLICFEEIKGHKGVLELLLFHPLQPTWLMSSADDNTVVVWELGLPKGTDTQTVKSRPLLTLKSKSIVRYFDVPPHGETLVGGCDDGCFLWKLNDIESAKEKTRAYFGKLEFPTKKNKFVPLDCVKCISDNVLATKRVEEGTILLWHSESSMLKNDLRPTHALQWRLTETPFLKFSYSSGCDILLAGDNVGCLWLYDIEPLLSDADGQNSSKIRAVDCTKVLSCPNETTKVFNQVATCSSMNYIVAVADSNVVCIWRRLPDLMSCVS